MCHRRTKEEKLPCMNDRLPCLTIPKTVYLFKLLFNLNLYCLSNLSLCIFDEFCNHLSLFDIYLMVGAIDVFC